MNLPTHISKRDSCVNKRPAKAIAACSRRAVHTCLSIMFDVLVGIITAIGIIGTGAQPVGLVVQRNVYCYSPWSVCWRKAFNTHHTRDCLDLRYKHMIPIRLRPKATPDLTVFGDLCVVDLRQSCSSDSYDTTTSHTTHCQPK